MKWWNTLRHDWTGCTKLHRWGPISTSKASKLKQQLLLLYNLINYKQEIVNKSGQFKIVYGIIGLTMWHVQTLMHSQIFIFYSLKTDRHVSNNYKAYLYMQNTNISESKQ